MKKEVSSQEELTEILKNNETVILDFYAEWCGPCKALGKILDDIIKEDETITVASLNVDECDPDIVDEYNVKNLPTLLKVVSGLIENRRSGMGTAAQIKEFIGNV